MAKPKFCVSKPYVGRRKNKNLCRQIVRYEMELEVLGPRSEKCMSSTAKKFQAFGITQEFLTGQSFSSDSFFQDSSDCFFIVQKSCLQNLVEKFCCPSCHAVGHIKFNILDNNSYGFSTKFQISCDNCHDFLTEQFMSSRLGNSRRAPFEVNVRSVLAFRSIGCGFSAMKDWCSSMNLPNCMSNEAYSSNQSKVGAASKATFEELLTSSREAIKNTYKNIGIVPNEQGILDIADGSWQRRGHSLHNGMASVIELMTGLPLDYEVLLNFCGKCKITDQSDQNEEWKLKHSNNCLKTLMGLPMRWKWNVHCEYGRGLWKRME